MNTKLWIGIFICIMGLFDTRSALAAEGPFQQGSWELKLNSDFDNAYRPFIEYYLVDNLAIFALGMYDHTETKITGGIGNGTTDKVTETRFGVGLEYNIPTGAVVVPYASVAVENLSMKEDDGTTVTKVDGPALDLEAGIKIMVGTRGSVNIGVLYTVASLDTTVSGSTNTADVKDLAGQLGFSLHF